MSRIRSHCFLCLNVCMTLTSWLHRCTWHPLLYQRDGFNGEAGLIGLLQVINFSPLFYKLPSGYMGWVCSLYMSPEEDKVREFHWRTDALFWSAHTDCCVQESRVKVINKIEENSLIASQLFHYWKPLKAIKMAFYHKRAFQSPVLNQL